MKYSFDTFIVKGRALEEYECQIASLVEFLSRSSGLKIETIVCDFIKDELGNAFFTQCKGFTIAPEQVNFYALGLQRHTKVEEMKAIEK